MRSIKLEGLAAAFIAAALAMTVVTVVTIGLIGRATDNGCIVECLERQDLTMQTSMAVAAWAMVLVSLGTGLLVLRTLHHTRRSADAAFAAVAASESIGKRQVRAYLAIDGAVIKVDTAGSINFHTELRNTGQSPASAINAHLRLGLFEITISQEGEVIEDEQWGMEQNIQVPNVSATQAFPVHFSFITLLQRPISSIFNTDEHIAMKATLTVIYRDVFGDEDTITESFAHLVRDYAQLNDLALSRRTA